MSITADSSFWEWVLFLLNQYGSLFLKGTGVTLLISVIGTVAGFVIGLLVAIVRTIPLRPGDSPLVKLPVRALRGLLAAYIEVFRSTPMIVQAIVIYYGFAQMFGLDMEPIPAGILVVSINTGAYMAEIVRGGIQSVDIGQTEAAHSIGMNHWQTMTSVVLPQAIRNVLPSVGNEFVVNIKDTSVLNVISVTELFFQTKTAAGAYYRTFEAFFITCVIYFVLVFTVTRLLRLLERKMDGPSNYTVHGSQTTPQGTIKVGGGQS